MAPLLRITIFITLCVSSLWISGASSEEGLVTISAPSDGEKLTAGKTYKVDYEVKDGLKAHHVHLFVDGKEAATGHKLKGSFPLGPLTSGERKVCVVPVNKNHTPIGAQSCISVLESDS